MEGEQSALANLQTVVEDTTATPETFSWPDAQKFLRTEGVEVNEGTPDGVMTSTEFINLKTLDRLTRTETRNSQSFRISTKSPDRRGRHWFRVSTPSGQQEPYLDLTYLPDDGSKQEIIKNVELSQLTPQAAKQLLPAVEAGFGISLCGGRVGYSGAASQEWRSLTDQPPSVFKQIEAIFVAEYAKLQQSLERFKQLSTFDKAEAAKLLQKYEPRYRAHQHLEARLDPLMRVMQQVRLTAEQAEAASAFPTPTADFRPSTSAQPEEKPASPPPAPPETPPEKTHFQRLLGKLQHQPVPEPASKPAMRGESSHRQEPQPAPASLHRRPDRRSAGPVERPAKRPDLPPPSMKLSAPW